MSLENLISNNKALMTVPAATSVNLVALQQIVEAPVSQPQPTDPKPQVNPNVPPVSSAGAPTTANTTPVPSTQTTPTPQQQAAHNQHTQGKLYFYTIKNIS